jgi:hypothetical protein
MTATYDFQTRPLIAVERSIFQGAQRFGTKNRILVLSEGKQPIEMFRGSPGRSEERVHFLMLR